MQTEALRKLVFEIQARKTETQTIELKRAEHGCPTRLFDTLSSFSNQDEGGVIVFGIDEKDDYKIKGVYDAQDLQKKVTEQCKQMEPSVRALFTVCDIDGIMVVSAEIPGVDIADRPVFYKGVGRLKGSYVRVGESDEPMSEYEIYSYEAFRKRIRDDIRIVENAKMQMFNKNRMEDYLTSVKNERRNLSENVSENEILELMGVTCDGAPTLVGLMTFSKYPQTYFPQLCITAVSLPGTEMGSIGVDGERFIDNKRITGAIPDMLEEAVEFVRRNSRTKTIIDENGKRADKNEYPIKAVREAILNALVHRDYSIHTENVPIRIEMYRDRMEITNSGGLYGKITIDALGKVHPETRNAVLANMLELLNITENRYSGIPTMRMEFLNAGLPAPIFSVRHGEFKVIMKNGYHTGSGSITDAIMDFCSVPRSRSELISFVGKSRNYVMGQIIAPLVESGRLKLTMPDKPKSSNQRYVRS
ncbi:MAG: putative DNA binding domain-containing protein [Oscillospiraceae bacterium]|nr:putative DNA binding domain-containing protein [Oscillospiraceae bacterium]